MIKSMIIIIKVKFFILKSISAVYKHIIITSDDVDVKHHIHNNYNGHNGNAVVFIIRKWAVDHIFAAIKTQLGCRFDGIFPQLCVT